jgi:hypothetical protein
VTYGQKEDVRTFRTVREVSDAGPPQNNIPPMFSLLFPLFLDFLFFLRSIDASIFKSTSWYFAFGSSLLPSLPGLRFSSCEWILQTAFDLVACSSPLLQGNVYSAWPSPLVSFFIRDNRSLRVAGIFECYFFPHLFASSLVRFSI